MKSKLTRRDLCFLVGKRANKLSREQGAAAWFYLAGWTEELGTRDMPKFADLIEGIREATIAARQPEAPAVSPGETRLLRRARSKP